MQSKLIAYIKWSKSDERVENLDCFKLPTLNSMGHW
jgi:hypothetical protein